MSIEKKKIKTSNYQSLNFTIIFKFDDTLKRQFFCNPTNCLIIIILFQFEHLDSQPNSLHNLSAIAKRLEKRRIHLKKACNYLGLNIPGNDSLHKPNPWEFLVDTKHHLVWCNVFKAASTSWMYNFNILAGYI